MSVEKVRDIQLHTCIRRGEICVIDYDKFTARFRCKEFRKSVRIWRSGGHESIGDSFLTDDGQSIG